MNGMNNKSEYAIKSHTGEPLFEWTKEEGPVFLKDYLRQNLFALKLGVDWNNSVKQLDEKFIRKYYDLYVFCREVTKGDKTISQLEDKLNEIVNNMGDVTSIISKEIQDGGKFNFDS